MRAQEERTDKSGDKAGSRGGVRRTGSAGTPAERLLALQRSAGNAAVARAVAEQRHQHDAHCGHGPAVQRSAVHQVLRSPGRPLDEPLRTEMEGRFGGADFSDVRVHTDTVAQRSATEIGARAYTSGSHVVLGPGGTDKHTLAHELTHVLQQRRGSVPGTDNGSGLRVSSPDDHAEREAEANAHRVMSAPVQRMATDEPSATAPESPEPFVGDSVQRVYTGAPYVTYGALHNGAGSYMKAELHPGRIPPGSSPRVKPQWWPRAGTGATADWFAAQMVQGHLLNENLGGPGNTLDNLTPLTKTGNSNHLHMAEAQVKKEINNGNIVEYEVKAVYGRVTGAGLGATGAVAADIDANYATKIPERLEASTTVYDTQGNWLYGESWIVHNEKH
ncbi:DUF4157 domain-containing protein [Streptomyces ipomoeae]|uniref:DUF4157 domain-containing protein n=1 Tax=Streptomyces ipomoeae TaxID=103232 RepID=A0AAE9B2N1_9ACTN|nr:DUF4157 domain-containing protein [Streptomyces ipomoeae]